jgi:hypothetical protein
MGHRKEGSPDMHLKLMYIYTNYQSSIPAISCWFPNNYNSDKEGFTLKGE